MKRLLFIAGILLAVLALFAACGGESNKENTTTEPIKKENTTTEPIKQQEYNITYHLNNGKSGSVKKPTEKQLVTYIPEREGYEFGGWYCDADLFFPWDMEEKVTSDFELYAEWIELPTVEGQLSAPKVTVKDNVFSWKPVSGANGYRVRVSYQGYTENYIWEDIVNGTTWTFPESKEADVYMVRICANGNGVDTINSVYITRRFALRVLSATDNIVLDRATSILSWDAVENAEEYAVYVDEKKVSTQTETTFNFSEYDANKYSVKIRATKPNWKTSSKEVTINKQTLRVPNVILSINSDTKTYVLEWDSVTHATDYILNFDGKEVRVKEKKYTFNNDSDVWGDAQTVSFTVNAYSDSGDYYMSTGGQSYTASKLYTLTVENGTGNDINVELRGTFWAPVTVSFDLNGASGTVADQIITTQNTLTYPEIPEREGYIFRGWFTEPECTNVFDFTQTLESDVTLYAGWYKLPSGATFCELMDGRRFESTTSYEYTYFRSLSGKSITIWYQQDDRSPTSYMYFYDVTADQAGNNDNGNEWSFSNPVPAETSISVKAGHVYYVRTHSSSKTNLRLSFNETFDVMHFIPNDGGKAISDYVLHMASKKMSNTVIYGETYSVANLAQLGYVAIGSLDGDNDSIQEVVIPAQNSTFTVKGFTVATEMANFEFESTAIACRITGIKDKSVTEIVVPNYVTSIGEASFIDCASLEKITLPFIGTTKNSDNTVNSVFGCIFGASYEHEKYYFTPQWYQRSAYEQPEQYGYRASAHFYIPKTLKSVIITDGIIPYGAFSNCWGLSDIILPNNIQDISTFALYGTAIKSIQIPESVKVIGSSAFAKTSIEKIEIPNKVTTICSFLFYECKNLKDIVISENVTEIADFAFYGCVNLQHIEIPNSVISIALSAYPPNLIKNEFDNAYYVGNADNPYRILVEAKNRAITSYKIHDKTEVIGGYAFENCKNLEKLIVPDGVKYILVRAIDYNYNLEHISIPKSIIYIGYLALSVPSITYEGTMEQWNSITKDGEWGRKYYEVICSDGIIDTTIR